MRPDPVVDLTVLLGKHLHLGAGAEDLPIQQLVPELSVEALHIPVLPR